MISISRTHHASVSTANRCVPNPCYDGGICFQSATVPNSYQCACPVHLTGTNCETRGMKLTKPVFRNIGCKNGSYDVFDRCL